MDTSLFEMLNGLINNSAWLNALILFFAEYLAYVLVAVFILSIVLTVEAQRDRLRALVFGFGTLVLSRAIAEIIHFFYHHPRPFVALGTPHLLTVSGWSFPSGHASMFFALATIIYFRNKNLGILFFVASALMGLARIAAGVHYPSDILGGAILGILVALAVQKLESKRRGV